LSVGVACKIVDNEALYHAFSDGWIVAAGLDDTEVEPTQARPLSPRRDPLFSLNSCVVTPHVAYVSEAALRECRRIAAENARGPFGEATPESHSPVMAQQSFTASQKVSELVLS
jgi:phosphoglycerate dehydrogenase-like enzyme